MSRSGFRSGSVARVVLLIALICCAGAASAASFLYTGGHELDANRVAALGHSFVEFTGDDAGWTAALGGAYGPFDAIVVGESSGSQALTLATSTAIASFVSEGGRVIVASDHNGNVGFLNAVFGYSTSVRYGCQDDGSVAGTLQAASIGTSFDSGPAAVVNASCTSAFYSTSVPASASKLYTGSDAGTATTVAFAGGYGSGQLVWLGWDYCCADIEAQTDDWYMVLDSSLKVGTCGALVGGQLTLCQKICEVDQTPSTRDGLITLYTAAFGVAPPCGGFVAPLRPPMAYDGLSGG